MIDAQKKWIITCLAGAISQALPLLHGPGIALAQIVTTTGEVSPAIPATGGSLSGPLVVGDAGQGSLSAADAAIVSTDSDVVFGAQAGSEGQGSLSGAGTAMTSDGGLYVGSLGLGTLNLTDAATFTSNGLGSIGDQAAAQGSVSVTGPGTAFNIATEFYVGRGGDGTLAISQGGTATVGGLISVGDQAGSQGAIELSGVGTTLNGSNDLFVGYSGNGALSIAGGAVATTNGSVVIANESGSVGTASVSGQGSALNTDGNLSVGSAGTGSLQLSDGASVSAGGNIGVGEQAGSQGTLTLDGPGTTLNGAELYVGYSGTGSLSLTNGATATAGRTTFGDQAGSQATVTLTGPGTSLSADHLGIGQGGNATMDIRDGATASSSGRVIIGNDLGATGAVTLAGQGSALTSGSELTVGWAGTGRLDMSDGATASATRNVRIGEDASANGTVTLTGPGTTASAGEDFGVGSSGTGRLEMSNGATVSAGEIFGVGAYAGSNGSVVLSGQGTTISAVQNFVVGNFGNGTLEARDGAAISTNGALFVGAGAGINGVVDLAGAGTGMTVGAVLIGNAGNGSLIMSDGAAATVSSNVLIGNLAGSQGTVTLSGTDTVLNAAGNVSVGNAGTGSLQLADGATANAGRVTFADQAGSQATATVAGQGTSLLASYLGIGQGANATMDIRDGASVSSSGAIILGNDAGANGAVTLTGQGSTLAAGNNLVVASGGTGQLDLSNGATASAGGIFGVGSLAGSNGAVTLSGPGTAITSTGNMEIGIGGNGTLKATDGAALSTSTLFAGVQAGSNGTVELAGAGTTLTAEAASIGYNGNGSLIMSDGALATVSSNVLIGDLAGSQGTVTLSGTNTVLNAAGNLSVGNAGTGSLQLADGATANAGRVTFADQAGSQATATVAGQGTSLLASYLGIGQGANATMDIRDGASVSSSGDIILGNDAGANGAVTLTGQGSTLVAGNNLVVASGGTGQLDLSNGATASAGDIFGVGSLAGSNGAVTLSGPGTAITSTGNMEMGIGGNGTLKATDGAALSTNTLFAGVQAGSNGTVELAGAGTTLTAEAASIGYNGNGSLIMSDGALATVSSNVLIGDLAGSQGTVTLSGTDTVLNAAGNLSVGNAGTGSLQLADGANLLAGGDIRVGEQAGAQGALSVAGAGTTLTGNTLSVGYAGTGSFSLTDGATANAGRVTFADQAGSQATATVAGQGTSLLASYLGIGQGANATMDIRDGASVYSSGGISLGNDAGANGAVTLTGQGSTLAAGNDLAVAWGGTGQLDLSNGATASAGDIFGVGGLAGSNGAVTLSGPGTAIISTGNMGIGVGGSGTLKATEGAALSTNRLFAGVQGGSNGSVELAGAGTTLTAEAASIGHNGNGSLIMSDGALATVSSNVLIGNLAGSQGNVTLSGPGTGLNAGSNISVGNAGNGVLSVKEAATLRSSGALVLAAQAGSQGTLNIGGDAGLAPQAPGAIDVASINFGLGSGLINLNHSSESYVLAPAITGNGMIDHQAGITHLTGNSSSFAGTTSVTGGTLYVENSLGGNLNVMSGGTLAGAGTVGTLMVAAQGTVSPGYGTGTSYQTLTVSGDYHAQAGSVYLAQINLAPVQADRIWVQGTATVDPGSRLGLRFSSPSATNQYALGTRYVVLTADQGLTGTYTVSDAELKLSSVLNLQPGYDSQNAYLEVVQSRSLSSLAQTQNQVATLTAVDNTPANNELKTSLTNVPTEEGVRQVADSLSGEIHASSKILMLDHSRFLREAVSNRLRQTDSNPATDGALRTSGDEWGGWGQMLHSSGHLDGGSSAASVDDNYNGFLVGADRSIGDQWRLGVVAGAAHSNLSSSLTSKSKGDDYTFGAYAGTSLGAWRVSGGAAYSYQKLSIKRETEILGSRATTSSHPKAHLGQVFTEIGYPFTFSATTIEPFAQLAYVRIWAKDFEEHGGAAPLKVDSSKEGTTLTTVGAHASSQWQWNNSKMSIHGTLGWRHAEGYVESNSTMSFTDSNNFTVVGVSLPRNAAVVETGLKLQARKDLAFDVSYNGLLGDGTRQNTIKGSVVWQF